MASQQPADVSGLTYEQARDELVSVVASLEQGATSLEEALALWDRGEALAARCEEWLLGARRRLEAARDAASADQLSAARDAASASSRADDPAAEA